MTIIILQGNLTGDPDHGGVMACRYQVIPSSGSCKQSWANSSLIVMPSLIKRLGLAQGIQGAGWKRAALCEIAFPGMEHLQNIKPVATWMPTTSWGGTVSSAEQKLDSSPAPNNIAMPLRKKKPLYWRAAWLELAKDRLMGAGWHYSIVMAKGEEEEDMIITLNNVSQVEL